MTAPAPDYRLCDQTVTVYHRAADGAVTRMVYPNAWLQARKKATTHTTAGRSVSKIGLSERTESLLVLPWAAEPCPVAPGDKVVRGIGPEVIDWNNFAPARYPGVVVLRYAELNYWQGKPCHLEAGG